MGLGGGYSPLDIYHPTACYGSPAVDQYGAVVIGVRHFHDHLGYCRRTTFSSVGSQEEEGRTIALYHAALPLAPLIRAFLRVVCVDLDLQWFHVTG